MTLLSMLLQGGEIASQDSQRWLVIFVGVIAFCSLVQFLVLVGAGIGMLKAWKSVSVLMADFKQKSMPIIGNVNRIVEDATPKVKMVAENFAETSTVIRRKVADFDATLTETNQTLKDVNRKTQAQVARVDGMVASALTSTDDIASTIQQGIRTPVREVAGLVNGLKAGLDVFFKGKGSGSRDRTEESKERTEERFRRTAAGPVPVSPVNEPVERPVSESAARAVNEAVGRPVAVGGTGRVPYTDSVPTPIEDTPSTTPKAYGAPEKKI